jgi:hypothetical protein
MSAIQEVIGAKTILLGGVYEVLTCVTEMGTMSSDKPPFF